MEKVISKEEKSSRKNKDNLNRLIASRFGSLAKCSIHNLFSKELSEQESFALSLSLKLSLLCSKIDKENIFLGFESFYK